MARRSGFLQQYFYFVMSLVVAMPVVYGFSFTVGPNLLHPTVPRPRIVWAHAAIFTGWLLFFVVQSGLVRLRQVRWHRRLGLFGVALGASVFAVGAATAVVMGRFHIVVLHATDAERFLVIPLFDMACFAVAFTLAVLWRKNSERHRRLMLIATAVLTAAGWGRFPAWLLPSNFFYGGVDLLILCGVARDLVVDRRVHPVYLYALPILVVCQAAVVWTALHDVQPWLRFAHAVLR